MKIEAGALLSSIRIDRDSDRKISIQLYMGLKDILLSGGLSPGGRLPASRTLAQEIGVSRTTVIDALDRLIAEGLLDSRVGSGTYVSEALSGRQHQDRGSSAPPVAATKPQLSRATTQAASHLAPRAWLPHKSQAFVTALPALDAFPMAHWSRLSARHWRGDREAVMGYGHPLGHQGLRRAIATHLNASRGIKCDPDQIFIVAGAQQAFSLVSSLMLNPGDPVWFENPGAIGARNAFIANGANLIPVPIDKDGLCVADGLRNSPQFRLAFVTPSHQQPLGSTMSLSRRLELLKAAEAANAFIVEDDYDGDFFYGDQPLPALKSIDTQERVVYVGTFSKSLFPSLRLGFVLSPRGLVETFEQMSSQWLSGVPTATQATVADFMNEGLFATHIRMMRRTYKARHDALLEATRGLRDVIDIQEASSGFHTVGYLPDAVDETNLVARAAQQGILLAALNRYCLSPIAKKGVVLGFGGVNPEQIHKGAEVLERLLRNEL
ncbi:MocR-like pyridoxine biosynthesis transcription factor PdxR [Rhodovibrionaceae bacterium A322]